MRSLGQANVGSIAESFSSSSPDQDKAVAGDFSLMRPIDEPVRGRTSTTDFVGNLPAKIELALSETLILNTESTLSLTLDPEIDASNAEIHVNLPEGISLSSGSLRWNGSLSKNHLVRIDATLRGEIVGIWCVEAIATSKSADDRVKTCSAQRCVMVTDTEEVFLDAVNADATEMGALEPEYWKSPENVSAESSGMITVYGSWFFENRSGDSKPARFARVELWDLDKTQAVRLATTYVQGDGYYEFPAMNNNGSSGDGFDIYVKLFCQSYQYNIAWVLGYRIYQTDTHYNVTDGYHDMGRWIVEGNEKEYWWIYDDIVDGYFWLLNRVGWSRSEVWVIAKNHGGGSYCTGDGIVLEDGDEWSRETILHEYAHCIHYAARSSSFPSQSGPKPHYPDTEADGGFALTEGWAEFFSCAVDNDPRAISQVYFGSLESTVYADSPFGHGDYGDWDGDCVEGAVAQVFWDIFDGTSASDYPPFDEDKYGDYISDEFGKLWSIFLNGDPNNIHEFWNQWTPKDARIWAIFWHAKIIEPRNIAVTGVYSYPEFVTLGGIVDVNVTVNNQGDFAENINIFVFADDMCVCAIRNVTMERGNSGTFTVGWNTTGMTKGDYTISARAIVLPEDLNTTDNSKTGSVTRLLSPEHDVCISGIVTLKMVIGKGYPVAINLEVGNFGSFSETVGITVFANASSIEDLQVTLNIGQTKSLTLTWNTTGWIEGKYTISGYAEPVPGETDTSDNTYTDGVLIIIAGDVNGDSTVDIYDLIQIATIYGSVMGEPTYNPKADQNSNSVIDIYDLIIVANHYGEPG